MPDPIALPQYASNRLIGIELEYDAGGTEFTKPTLIPSGWSEKYDGSLRNGFEYVLEPALSYNQALPVVQTFCDAFNAAKTNISTRGGYHIHVQAHDYDDQHHDSTRLCKIYKHFQPIINSLVGKSRVGNSYCQGVTVADRDALIRNFHLTTPARNRGEAKGSRNYSAVNLAMMRCTNPNHRTIEFRQQSSSKRLACVWGWATLMVALVDLAKNEELCGRWLRKMVTLGNFKEMLGEHSSLVGATGLAEWVQWRHDYLNAEPTPQFLEQLQAACTNRPSGLFTLARAVDANLAVVKKAADMLVESGALSKRGTRWVKRASADQEVGAELAELEAQLPIIDRMLTQRAERIRSVAASVPPARPIAAAPAPVPLPDVVGQQVPTPAFTARVRAIEEAVQEAVREAAATLNKQAVAAAVIEQQPNVVLPGEES